MDEYVKNMKNSPSYRLGDLEKFHGRASSWALGLGKILSSASIQALGFEKMLSFPFLRLQHVDEAPSVARCDVSLFRLLHISS